MQNFNKDITLGDIWIMQDDFTKLSDNHFQLLEQCGFLEKIINHLEEEVQVRSDSLFP